MFVVSDTHIRFSPLPKQRKFKMICQLISKFKTLFQTSLPKQHNGCKTEAAGRRCSTNLVSWKMEQNFKETPVVESLKGDSSKVFSCQLYKFSKKISFTEHLWVSASVLSLC